MTFVAFRTYCIRKHETNTSITYKAEKLVFETFHMAAGNMTHKHSQFVLHHHDIRCCLTSQLRKSCFQIICGIRNCVETTEVRREKNDYTKEQRTLTMSHEPL